MLTKLFRNVRSNSNVSVVLCLVCGTDQKLFLENSYEIYIQWDSQNPIFYCQGLIAILKLPSVSYFFLVYVGFLLIKLTYFISIEYGILIAYYLTFTQILPFFFFYKLGHTSLVKYYFSLSARTFLSLIWQMRHTITQSLCEVIWWYHTDFTEYCVCYSIA